MGDPAERLSVNLQALGTPGVPRRDDLIREVLEQTRQLQAGLGRLRELASVFGCAALHGDDRIVLTELVPQVLKALAHLMDQRNVSIRLQGFEQEVAVYGSAEWLTRALREYLDCAVRSAQRGAAIDLVLQGSGQRVMLRSRNRGLFMSGHARRAAMVPFGIGDDPSQPGPSIGLALAQHIVELHGGSVRIEDEAGVVDFVLELPAGAPAEQATQLSAEQAQRYARDMAQLMSRSMARRDAVLPGSKT
jgi:signal transduction histidine kinase